jgi:hypothetical protein
MLFRFSLILLLSLVFGFQGSASDDPFDYGNVDKGKYKNAFFGFEMKVHADWHPLTKAQSDALMKTSIEVISQGSEVLSMALKATEVNYAQLLTVFQHEMGAPVEFNPSIVLMVENLRQAPGVKAGADYLYHTQRGLEATQFSYSFSESSPESVSYAEMNFDAMTAYLHSGNKVIQQDYYCTVTKGFALCFVMSYFDEEQGAALSEMFRSLKANGKGKR